MFCRYCSKSNVNKIIPNKEHVLTAKYWTQDFPYFRE